MPDRKLRCGVQTAESSPQPLWSAAVFSTQIAKRCRPDQALGGLRGTAHHRSAVVALCCLAAACSMNTDVPPGVLVPCSSPLDPCPKGWVCRPAVGRCVDSERLNQPSPKLSAVTVSPTAGRVGTRFEATFTVETSAGLDRAP